METETFYSTICFPTENDNRKKGYAMWWPQTYNLSTNLRAWQDPKTRQRFSMTKVYMHTKFSLHFHIFSILFLRNISISFRLKLLSKTHIYFIFWISPTRENHQSRVYALIGFVGTITIVVTTKSISREGK